MPDFWKDVRYALRLLARSPVFAVTAALVLGIGIGANTLIFSIVDALLLRPLPFKNASQLVQLTEVHPTAFVTYDLPYTLYEQLSAQTSPLTNVLCQGDLDVAFHQATAVERIRVTAVSGNFFSALGIHAQIGRVLTPQDDKAGAMPAVLSHDFWRKWFAGSAAIGRTIRLNGKAFTVVGVLPVGMNGLTVDTSPDVRIPLTAGRVLAAESQPDSSDPFYVQIFGMLRPDMTIARAEAEIDPLLRDANTEALIRLNPKLAGVARNSAIESRLAVEPAGEGVSTLRKQFSKGLVLLMAGVGLLLLMSCANVACLLLARSAARSQEIGMRLMLGAGPIRIARQLLTEGLVLTLPGAALGVLLTYTAMPLIMAALPPIRDRAAVVRPLAVHVAVNLHVLSFVMAASILTALLTGVSPALHGARQNLAGSLRETRATPSSRGRNMLVAAQIAICVVLLGGATVLVQTFAHMRSLNAGFDRDHIVTLTVDPGLTGYKPDRARLLSRQLLEKARSLPGVLAVANAGRGLMRGTGLKTTLAVTGSAITKSEFLNCSVNSVTPGYFDAMGMRIMAGRDFTWSDDTKRPDTQWPRRVIVNQAFVRHFFPAGNALGRLFGRMGPDGLASADDQIIGIVSDAKYRSLREEIPPTVYQPALTGFDYTFVLHMRTHARPESLIAPVRAALRPLDPELPFIEVSTLREEVEISLWQERLLAGLSGIFGSFAALLAGIGLYGALDFAVKSRTREIGVRVALGADPFRVIRLLGRDTLMLVAAGCASGFVIYAASARWIRQVLYDVVPWDPVALGSVLLFVGAVAFCAAATPIWRAVRIQPASALRHE